MSTVQLNTFSNTQLLTCLILLINLVISENVINNSTSLKSYDGVNYVNTTQNIPSSTVQDEKSKFPNPYVPVAIATLVIATILVLIHCSYNEKRTTENNASTTSCFAYRSCDTNRYNTRGTSLASRYNRRYNPFSGYPGPPDIDDPENRRYLGQSRLPHYRRPHVSIINEVTGEILIDANQLSLDISNNKSFPKSFGSSSQNEELHKYRKYVEQRRQQKLTELGGKVEKEKLTEGSTDEPVMPTSTTFLPLYKSRENIQEYFLRLNEGDNISIASWQKPPALDEQSVLASTPVIIVEPNSETNKEDFTDTIEPACRSTAEAASQQKTE